MKTALTILIASAIATHANSHGFLTGTVFESNGPTFAGVAVGEQLFGTWAYDASEADFDLAVMFNTVFTLQTDTYLFYTGTFKPVVDADEVPIAFSMTNWHDWLFSAGGGIWIHEGMDFSTVRATLAFVPDNPSVQRQAAVPEGGATAGLLALVLTGMLAARKL